ncbi:MAG TPA: transposase [Alphaproteobacteria bacterium]|nr:transposase [Alphaproteobacteria bacterium]HQS94695.1 transposase [Alphaproteobacteria bacterium]
MECDLDGYRVYLAGTRSSAGELVIVMFNQNKREKILSIYKKRWTIERLFFNSKTNGFNLEDTHLKSLSRIENLMAVLASAMVLSFLVGRYQEKKRRTPYKKTVKSPAYSTFRRGFDFIRHFLIKSFQEALDFLSLLFPENLPIFK